MSLYVVRRPRGTLGAGGGLKVKVGFASDIHFCRTLCRYTKLDLGCQVVTKVDNAV